VFADHDERIGRLRFGVENANAIRGVEASLRRLGLSSADYVVEVTEPIRQMATLQNVSVRPIQAGSQIHFGGYLCTLGFNVDVGTVRHFITNSHCTNKQGGVEGTQYYQPLSSVNSTVIATEVKDPTYTRNLESRCPRGKLCRYSDASMAKYAIATNGARGEIASTSGFNNSSLTITGTHTITAQNTNATPVAVGATVSKIGRTTGWTQGKVTNTCVTTNVSGTNISQICQTFVTAGVNSGDSGSPVFVGTGNVTLVGILWGGSGSQFVFSPLANIVRELGSFNAVK
jgi:hypothetical protein